MIIFGASGDLTERKLIPALYNLSKRGLLPENFFVVGCARSPMSDEDFRRRACESIMGKCEGVVEPDAQKFAMLFYYIQGDYGEIEFYKKLKNRLESLDREIGTGGNHIYYLATPPGIHRIIVNKLGESVLVRDCGDAGPCARVVIEKPFGHDLKSAQELDQDLLGVLTERQIYRIDHYLGKETVQNILMFRFANSIFEPIWNREYIDHVQITVAEEVGVEHRAGYFDQAGTLRDMFQNHMLQMLALVAMEPPSSFNAESIRDEKIKLIRSIHPFDLDRLNLSVVRGQYERGITGGKDVPGYRSEKNISADSKTETFVAAKLLIDNWRWRDTPFYLRAGKRLPRKLSEIAVVFKKLPHSMFDPIKPEEISPNVLVLNVQPDEGMELSIEAKHPGPKLCMSELTMDFKYKEVFREDLPDAYERLLLDCMLGDQTLFYRNDETEASWSLLTPLLYRWNESGDSPDFYASGTWGPKESDELLFRDGRFWRFSDQR